MSSFLALDLGAGSGRAILGELEGRAIKTREVSRFRNNFVKVGKRYFWDMLSLFENIKESLSKAKEVRSVSVDTWGVDFALFTREGTLVSNPFSYRDTLFQEAMKGFLEEFGEEKLYFKTGIQYLPFNTVFQLYGMRKYNPSLLLAAGDLLMLPDAFNFLLSGKKAAELSIASTTGMMNPEKKEWDEEILDFLGVERGLFKEIVPPGTVLGDLNPEVSKDLGLSGVKVIASAGHDTACAVAAVPGESDDWAYISSGTWALVGVELHAPNLSKDAFKFGFTNEQGAGNKVRFLKNVTGLWILDSARHSFGDPPWEEILDAAGKAGGFRAFIDPDWEGFMNPDDMVGAIYHFLEKTGQGRTEGIGGISRVILESLALKISYVVKSIERITGKRIRRLNMVGGGTRNDLLCRFIAGATGLKLLAGPGEATSFGNLLLQAMALGDVGSLKELREIVRNSCALKEYEPEDIGEWEKAYERFVDALGLEVS